MGFSFLSIESLLVVILVIHMNIAVVYGSSAAVDRIALLEIKSKIIDDPQGVFRSWNDSVPFCRWQGVTCARRHQRVTSLSLTKKGLVGSLSPYVGNLSFLRDISLDNNQISGSIPPEIGHLFRLKVLSLINNLFTGEIPVNISSCSRLEVIDLSKNMLSGKIPNIFNSLLMVTILYLSNNNLTGGIPSTIGNLTSLQTLHLSYSPLGGTIPDSLNQLQMLRILSIGANDLVGAIPSFLFNFSMLTQLTFAVNQLHGHLPSNLCSTQPNLEILEIAKNHINGVLPPSISNCSKLAIIDVGENDFTGEIAIDFGKLQYLNRTILANNIGFENMGLHGMNFFDSLSNCSKLNILEIGNIQLGGVLRNSLGNFSSQLHYLGLYLNNISGHIPPFIGNLIGLTFLDLGLNNFTGMIPESIGKLRNLKTVYLDENALSGIIPRSIGNLSFITELQLSKNKFEGTIPSSIGNCKSLISLVIDRNNLQGSVPKELFQLASLSILLNLSQNNLSGVLPQEIGNLTGLGQLDLSQNRLSSELPKSFSNCISLEFLNLSGNLFHGSIPEEFSSLRGLEYVDLSRNNFSGYIPTYLQQIPLKHIDLSYNNFEGEVPVKGVFANISAIYLAGNIKLCGGLPELNLSKCTNTTGHFKRGRKLSVRAIVAISLCLTVAGLALLSFLSFYFCIKKKIDKPSESLVPKSLEKISYGQLFKATDGFSLESLIGTGSFASVYKGVLNENSLTVAIKVLNLQRRGGLKSFMAECDALRNIRHRNLVKVITSCSSADFKGNDFKALVYDFMPNGNLESWLHSIHHMLDIVQRISILKDVASALDYLHCRCGNVIVHCDLKPSNILLDADMVAHVGDFGLAKILSIEDENNNNSSLIRGTVGYAPPEYGLGNEVSTRGDIYSYGILLLEMLTGKKPVDPMFREGLSLHSYVKSALADGFVLQIVDPVLLNEGLNEVNLIALFKIGVQCSFESPQDRMDIEAIVHELFSIKITTRP